MMQQQELTAVISAFARYGFRKTSMDDIAGAMGISRQALYKKYSSKEAVFHSVINQLITSTAQKTLALLNDETMPVAARIVAAFDCWAGQYVELVSASPHSAEILDATSADMSDESRQAEDDILETIAGLFGRRSARTRNVAYTLMMASKGLLVKTKSRKDYVESMERIVSVFID